MLFNDEQSGLFSFLIGLIILVMAGVALSVMADSKFSFARSESETKGDLTKGESEIERLKTTFQERGHELSRLEPQRREAEAACESTLRQVATLTQREQELKSTREDLLQQIPAVENGFAHYRTKYRDATWAAAAGESLGNLKTRGGREYHQVVIVRVTHVGLEIRHELGIARLQAPDLDAALQDRFQWDNSERLAHLKEESAYQEAMSAVTPKKTDLSDPQEIGKGNPYAVTETKTALDTAKVESLRRKVMGWRSNVEQLTAEKSQAQSAAYGRQSSVPGSLETWQAKAERLTSALARAKAEFAAAKADLAAVAPDDPLLHELEKP